MIDYINTVVTLFIIIVLVYAGNRLDRIWNLSRHYISPPLLSGMLGTAVFIPVYLFTDLNWVPEPIAGRLLVTAFLFYIGVRMGLVYTIKHLKTLTLFMLFSIVLLVLFEALTWLFFRNDPELLMTIGPMSFAWNDEWSGYLQNNYPDVNFVFHISLLYVLLLSPLFIKFISKNKDLKYVEYNQNNIGSPLAYRSIGLFISVIATFIAYGIKTNWFELAPFMFDFVFSMAVGLLLGAGLRQKHSQHPTVLSIMEIGTWSLYSFIVFMIITAVIHVWDEPNWYIASLLLAKHLIFFMIIVCISRIWVKNLQHMVLASATWAFLLSAPVTCMNAMRTVTNRHGNADDIILVVPPVILWLINYPHYFIYIWLYGN
jgi:Na+/glutamate symporter